MNETARMSTFLELSKQYRWRPIPGCPGRFLLAGGPTHLTPERLAAGDSSDAACRSVAVYRPAAAEDPVAVLPLADGGLISYRKPDGRWLHTLCDPAGFRRKLERLGIPSPDTTGSASGGS